MAGLIDGIDLRTNLVGRNRLELLLFKLGTKQRFGINVFKVREVIRCPELTKLPQSHRVVRGIAHLRGQTITIMDLGLALGQEPIPEESDSFIILTEFNRSVQGFMVRAVDRIININWEEVLPPPKGAGTQNYMTAVSKVDDELVEIIDVEKVLAEVTGVVGEVNQSIIDSHSAESSIPQKVLVSDDSVVARKQIVRTLEQLGVECITANDGKEALTLLRDMLEEDDIPITQKIGMVISDIEMPEMDGYTFTKEVKNDPRLKELYILLHTSLSGVFNENMVVKVGADQFIRKFDADELAQAISTHLSIKKDNEPDVA